MHGFLIYSSFKQMTKHYNLPNFERDDWLFQLKNEIFEILRSKWWSMGTVEIPNNHLNSWQLIKFHNKNSSLDVLLLKIPICIFMIDVNMLPLFVMPNQEILQHFKAANKSNILWLGVQCANINNWGNC